METDRLSWKTWHHLFYPAIYRNILLCKWCFFLRDFGVFCIYDIRISCDLNKYLLDDCQFCSLFLSPDICLFVGFAHL